MNWQLIKTTYFELKRHNGEQIEGVEWDQNGDCILAFYNYTKIRIRKEHLKWIKFHLYDVTGQFEVLEQYVENILKIDELNEIANKLFVLQVVDDEAKKYIASAFESVNKALTILKSTVNNA